MSILVSQIGTQSVLTGNRETDARTAITRGLAEYIESLSWDALGGRHLAFQQVFQTWAEPETIALFPSAVVQASGMGSYEASKLTPTPSKKFQLPSPDGRVLVSPSEFVLDVSVEIWCTDPIERAEVVAACESMFNPISWMYGFMLDLPHYYNERSTFELKQSRYIDSDVEAIRRHRRAEFILTAQVPVIQVFSFPDARPKFNLSSIGTDVVVDNMVVTDC